MRSSKYNIGGVLHSLLDVRAYSMLWFCLFAAVVLWICSWLLCNIDVVSSYSLIYSTQSLHFSFTIVFMFSYNYTLSIISLKHNTDRARHSAACLHEAHALWAAHRQPHLRRFVVFLTVCLIIFSFLLVLLVLLLPARPLAPQLSLFVWFLPFISFINLFLFFAIFPTERDPRRKQVLEEPRPNISFVLCNACVTSPALVVLKDADIIAGQ